METFTRKMASVQVLNGVYPIEGADKICQYGINGWRVVDQVGKYSVGDLVVFCEVDAFIPNTVAPFLTKPGHTPKMYNEVAGEKLRTIRLRKALSQGLILPLEVLSMVESELMEGLDVSYPLNIQKWETPPEFTSADAKGTFPSFIFKTDQERIQNCCSSIDFDNTTWQVTEKLEGHSHTAYFYNGLFGVCSRNLDLKDSDNTFWNTARNYNLQEKLVALGRNIAIQSEQVGPGISGNIYNLTDNFLYVFDIFDIDAQCYFSPEETQELITQLGLTSAPVLESARTITETRNQIIAEADGLSTLRGTLREGLVFKANTKERKSFKAVSNKYLEKQK